MVIGVVNPGGVLPDAWRAHVVEALQAGLDVANGMHARLADIPQIADAARLLGRRLFDVRHPVESFHTASGRKRTGKRLLTVGTDCSVGKKYTALAINREILRRGVDADYRATGQTGILISGSGIAIDAVVADFAAGAAEALSPDNEADHWDVVEGQGSLFHPSFASVSLALLHGTQPDAFVVCHEPSRRTMRNVETPIARVEDVIAETTALGVPDQSRHPLRRYCPGYLGPSPRRMQCASSNEPRVNSSCRHAIRCGKASASSSMGCCDSVFGGLCPAISCQVTELRRAGRLQCGWMDR